MDRPQAAKGPHAASWPLRSPGARSLTSFALLTVLGALVFVVLSAPAAAPARAAGTGVTAEGVVPADVRAQFEGQALRRGISTPETNGLVDVRAGTVHQLFSCSADFVQGRRTSSPVEPDQEWVAGIESDGAPIGWLRVFKPAGGPAMPTGWNPDPVVGGEMLATTASALVEVPWDAEFFTLVDGVATPVHTSQWHYGLAPRTLAEVQQAFAERQAQSTGCDGDACSGGGGGSSGVGAGAPWTLVAMVALVAAAAGGAVVLLRRQRRGRGTTAQT